MMGRIAIPVGGALPGAHRGQMRRLLARRQPLIHGVIGNSVNSHLGVGPWLHPGPLYALAEILGLTRRKVIDVPRRTAGAARIHAHHRVAIGHPFLGIENLPVLVLVGRTVGDIRMSGDHDVPCPRVALLKRQALGVRTIGQQHRMLAASRGTENVRPQNRAIIHRDRHIPINLHAVANLALNRTHDCSLLAR